MTYIEYKVASKVNEK